MASYELYERFAGKDEATFRRDFVRPLLSKLGFYLVTEYHGQREYGKDFVFAELHRFGDMRYYGVQVKHEKRISSGSMITKLLDDVDQAFANPFTLPDSQEEKYISAFYIFNSGEITEPAKEDLIRRVRVPGYRGNVLFLHGERLDWLNKWATFQNDHNVRQKLLGLRNQLLLNIGIWDDLRKGVEKDLFGESRRPILAGIEAFLSSPVFPEHISEDDMRILWQQACIIDSIRSRYYSGIQPRAEIKRRDTQTLIQTINKAMLHAQGIISDIDAAISELKPL